MKKLGELNVKGGKLIGSKLYNLISPMFDTDVKKWMTRTSCHNIDDAVAVMRDE